MEDKKSEEEQGQRAFVFDMSADLHRAIALSDVYYGSGSSVIDLYKVTGKPIMIQNIDIDEHDDGMRNEQLHSDVILFGSQLLTLDGLSEKYPLFYQEWIPYKIKALSKYILISDYEYGYSAFLDVLYKTEEDNAKAELLYAFDNKKNISPLYNPPIRINDILLFSPARANKWALYNTVNGMWDYIEIPPEYCPSDKYKIAFGGGMVCGEHILFLPGDHGAFAKYHIKTKEITYYHKWYEGFKQFVKNPERGLLSAVLYYEDSLLLFSTQTNVVFEIDSLELNIKKTHKIGNFQSGFKHATKLSYSNIVYLLKYREPETEIWTETIVKWDLQTNKTTELKKLPIHLAKNHMLNACNVFMFWKDKIYISPLQGDSLLQLDPNTDEIKRIDLTPSFDFFKRKSKHYTWAYGTALPYVTFNPKRLCLTVQLPYDYSLADIELETGVISKRRKWYVTGIEDLQLKKGGNQNEQGLFTENIYYTIDDFLNQIKNNSNVKTAEMISTTENKNLGIAGQKIHAYIKSVLLNGGLN